MKTRMATRVLAAVFGLGLLAACNTAEGVGKDVEATGEFIEKSAEDASD